MARARRAGPGLPTRALRVLHVADSLHMGGGERHVVDLAVAQRRRGYDVEVACSVGGALAAELRGAGVPLHLLGARLVKRRVCWRYARALRGLVWRRRYDLVHGHMYASNFAAAVATAGSGAALVVTEHSEAIWRCWRNRAVSRWVLGRSRELVAVAEPIRRRLMRVDRAPARRITVINGTVTPSPLGAGAPPELPPELRGRRLVGVVARLQPEKGVAAYLEAVARVAPSLPEHEFLVVGDGPSRAELERTAERLGLRGRVHFLGYRADARRLIGCLEALVVPSYSEGTPLVIVEAMLARVPVIASRVGGIPAQARDGVEALLVPPGDIERLAAALERLLGDAPLRRRLGEAGRERARSAFCHSAMVDRTEAVYRRALGLSAPEEGRLPGPLAAALGAFPPPGAAASP